MINKDIALKEAKILTEEIKSMKIEFDNIYHNLTFELSKIEKLRVKPTKRVKCEMLYMKKRFESIYKALGKFHKGIESKEYTRIFIEI
jgi:hypothetical protein